MSPFRWPTLLAFLTLVLLAGCGEAVAPDLGPPDGWEGDGSRWWRAGTDTTRAFRSLETLAAMGIDEGEETYAADLGTAQRGGVVRQQVERAVQRGLVRLYRNEPAVVDSLFQRYVAPKVAGAELSGDLRETVDRLKRQGYDLINNHFREPRTTLRLGDDVPITFPDSLREAGVSGAVGMQVYLNDQGEPQAVALVERVHPVLDALAMQATTQMRWRPAYLMRRGNWRPIPAWARFKVNFRLPESE